MSTLLDKVIDQELDEREREAAAKAWLEKAEEQIEWKRRRSLHSGKVDETVE